ncbi:kelch-like protein 20 isoform X1 [Rhincodon typus]|uniref:kelch-like protein 20 isoform X1 n=1 Tax=Rhincodon typus TaxID=259920 RepID=UPI0020307085|nr:kelch-like protein 20 isoform X1 [Rhincodon typus]XP_048465842.1 kelch-like protein 20 isoform X1 [Rhincodon typus]XP_048465843.1 kelch-like protein 20 isoform X1 [Rhincodon typus]
MDEMEPFTEDTGNHLECEDYMFVESEHSGKVLDGLNSLRLNNAFCDVILCCDGQEFPCHRIVLASFSSYFRVMFSTDLVESRQERVAINGIEPQMVGLLVVYAYTARVLITRANVQALLAAANLLDVMSVREACCKFMERQMDETNCVGIHCFAEAHSCMELQTKSMNYILQHFDVVHKQEEFLSLSTEKLIEIISSDDLNIPSEEMVFEAVVLWLEKDHSRKQNFEKILEHIRLPLISPYYIHDIVESLNVIQESLPCQRLISEAKDYLLLQDRRGELQSSRTRPRRSTDNSIPVQQLVWNKWNLLDRVVPLPLRGHSPVEIMASLEGKCNLRHPHQNKIANLPGTTEMIIAVGGEDDKVVLRSVESFDPIGRQWKCLAYLPFAVSKHGLVASGSTLYLAGGEFPDGSASKEMWRYDPCFDMWHEMAAMNVARSELGLAMLDGFVFAVGGWEGSSRLDSVECYNPHTNTWHFLESMKMAVTSPAVVALHGFLYVAGGAVLEDGDGMDLVQVYNPKIDSWFEVAPMQIPRSGSAACVLQGKIYVIGGWHASTENTDKVEQYDPKTNTWKMCAPMNERRYRPGVAVIDSKIYVLGGEEGWDRYHDTIEQYSEETGKWEIYGEMLTSRSWLSCVSVKMHGPAPQLIKNIV